MKTATLYIDLRLYPMLNYSLFLYFQEKLFGERCKLYRYNDKSREWKERGVGEMKILYHPERKTYRLLLRREQVCLLYHRLADISAVWPAGSQ